MKKSKKFLAVAMALCMTAVSSSCYRHDKSDNDMGALGSAVKKAAENALQSNYESEAEAKIREVPDYTGKNESISDMCTFFKLDSLPEIMKKSRMYELMCDIIANDCYSFVTPVNDDGTIVEINADGSGWLYVIKTYDGIMHTLKNDRDIYIIDDENRQYIAYSLVTSLSPENGFITDEDIETISDQLSEYKMIFQLELVDNGSEMFNNAEYFYEDYGTNESSETVRLYYTGDKCIGPVKKGSGLDSAVSLSSSLITKVEIPSGYTEVTLENIFDLSGWD